MNAPPEPRKTIEFVFDFASPNAYLCHGLVKELAERHNADVVYRLCLLGGIFKSTGNQAPMIAFAGVPSKLEYQRVEMERFIRKHGLERFRMNPHFPLNTLQLIRGAVAAEQDGCLDEYIQVVLKGCWEDGEKMDDPQVLHRVLAAAGLDADRLLERTADPEVKAALIANTEAAVKRGAFGIPTFFVGDEMFFGKDRLAELEEFLASG